MDVSTYMREAAKFDNHRPENPLDALAHGLMAEVGEVAETIAFGEFGAELAYELGDVSWNLARLADTLGMIPDDLRPDDRPPAAVTSRAVLLLVSTASKVSGVLEFGARTTAPDDWVPADRLPRFVAAAWSAWDTVVRHCNREPEEVMQVNIEKLTHRYAERGLPTKESS